MGLDGEFTRSFRVSNEVMISFYKVIEVKHLSLHAANCDYKWVEPLHKKL